MKNTKKLYQFDTFLVHSPNQNGSYVVDIKNNQESGTLIDGNFDNNFYINKSPPANFQFALDINSEYCSDDIDFILHELRDQRHATYDNQAKMKKVFWVANCQDNSFLRPRIFMNYAYCTNIKVQYDEKNDLDEDQIGGTLNLKKPFFFECDRDIGFIEVKNLNGQSLYGYDNIAKYNSGFVYDALGNLLTDPNSNLLTDKQVRDLVGCCDKPKKILVYKDFFNLTGSSVREISSLIPTRRDSKTLIIPLTANSFTSTNRSQINLPNPDFPAGWTGGKLDLNTSRKSEIMVIEISGSFNQNQWIKIKNEENKSYLKFTWLSSITNGTVQNIQIYPHLNKVWVGGRLADPLTEYTIEVDQEFGTIYFDSLYINPNIPIQVGIQDSQAISILQSQTNNSTLYIQTLKTFY